ncbi:MAG: alpha/beta hydrolase [Tissierellaceae bacterium]|nr:alpha/beta hydrolase [Tissierellaceae bacterium]
MISNNFTFKSGDSTEIFVYYWLPKNEDYYKGVVQIAHGMAEHAGRYDRFAKFLTENGYIVYANDHRGHGKTAGSVQSLGYLADEDGFQWLVRDMHDLSVIIKNEYPNLPLFLFGHSMGSFTAQRYMMLYGNEINGVILSGSNGKQGIALKIGLMIAKWEIKKHGRKKQSNRLDRLIFGGYNKAFKPIRTASDWLSRDVKEVDKYIDDPYCGTVFTAGFFYDFLTGLIEIEDKDNISLVPKDLPIYIFSGDKDPVGKFGKGVIDLYDRYNNHGTIDIKYKLYKDGRHEMLNEINRVKVMNDVVKWVELHI